VGVQLSKTASEKVKNVWELATELCRRHGYLCLEKVPLEDVGFIAAVELAIYETILAVFEETKDVSSILNCFSSLDCVNAIMDSAREVAELALKGVYEYTIDVPKALEAIRILEQVIAHMERRGGFS
jgi:hypothetical protein